MDELATAAGITVRTLRFYRERGLIPPPRREGRIAWYDEHHLARLRTIAALLERGVIGRAMPQGDILGFAPPLCLTKKEADIVVKAAADAITSVLGSK